MSLHARALRSKFRAAEASVFQNFLPTLPGFARLLNTGAIRFRKITLHIPEWRLTFFCGFCRLKHRFNLSN